MFRHGQFPRRQVAPIALDQPLDDPARQRTGPDADRHLGIRRLCLKGHEHVLELEGVAVSLVGLGCQPVHQPPCRRLSDTTSVAQEVEAHWAQRMAAGEADTKVVGVSAAQVSLKRVRGRPWVGKQSSPSRPCIWSVASIQRRSRGRAESSR